MKKKRHIVGVAIGAILALVLTGCSASDNSIEYIKRMLGSVPGTFYNFGADGQVVFQAHCRSMAFEPDTSYDVLNSDGKVIQPSSVVKIVCGTCRGAEVYPGVLPAAVAIDWSLSGGRIGDRRRPLAANTLMRIEAGLRRYRVAPVPSRALLVPAGGTWNTDPATTAEPFRTRTTRDSEALVVPVEGRAGVRTRPASDPARTQTGRLQDALVVPLRQHGVARPAGTDPHPTVAAAGNHHALVMRNMTARGDQGQMCTPTTEPLRTILAEQLQSLVRWDHLLVPYYGTAVARSVREPASTVTTVERHALVGPEVGVDDCTFRMLEPHEIQAAMAFASTYVVLGNKRERVRQCGNAVTPPAARDLVAAVVESLTGGI